MIAPSNFYQCSNQVKVSFSMCDSFIQQFLFSFSNGFYDIELYNINKDSRKHIYCMALHMYASYI